MAKCIVCAKSAGPFYSLHKPCYKIYEDTKECLNKTFINCISSGYCDEKLIDTLQICKPRTQFSNALFESLLKRTWENQSKEVLKTKSLNSKHAAYMLAISSELGIGEEDVEPYLFYKLSNLEYLISIYENKPFSDINSKWSDEIVLEDGESLLWIFEDTMKLEQQRYSGQKEWTVFQSIIDNLFSKSQYKELAVKVDASGNLIITNKHYYYKSKEEFTKVAFDEINSITPMKNGVCIQTAHRDSMPTTYETGDGRFTYVLLRYAQDQFGKLASKQPFKPAK